MSADRRVGLLFVPTEKPPSVIEIKRALLAYDHVELFDPSDRDVVRPHLYETAARGFSTGFYVNYGPVRPLGKTRDFDDQFTRMREELRELEAERLVIVRPAPEPAPGELFGHPGDQSIQYAIYQTYRWLASDSKIVRLIQQNSRLDDLLARNRSNLDRLVLPGAEETPSYMSMSGPGGGDFNIPSIFDTLPPIQGRTPEDRAIRTRLILARLAALVRTVWTSEALGLHPYTSDPALSELLHQIASVLTAHVPEFAVSEEMAALNRRLSIVNGVVGELFIPSTVLRELTGEQILQLRDRNWYHDREREAAMFSAIRALALESYSDAAFEQKARREIDAFVRQRERWRAETLKLGANVVGDGVMLLATGLSTIPHLGFAAILLGAKVSKTAIDAHSLWRDKEALESMPGYALCRPYGKLVRRRR